MGAAHVARLTQFNQRIFPATMETRGADHAEKMMHRLREAGYAFERVR